MYKFYLKDIKNYHEYEELIKVFLSRDDFEFVNSSEEATYSFSKNDDKNILKQEIFLALSKDLNKLPPWGIITGIRPVKLFGEVVNRVKTLEEAVDFFKEYYLVSNEKTQLTKGMYIYQQNIFGIPKPKSIGIYVSIPFCPTRCHYCSFPSNQVPDEEIAKYLVALHKEIDFVGQKMRNAGLYAESIYIGGGTPTTLNSDQVGELVSHLRREFATDGLLEFTMEAGRPDTITYEKLLIARNNGVDRISINPQTMKDETLKFVGRNHSTKEILEAFEMAKSIDGLLINADLIAGLPMESLEDFADSLKKVINLNPDNITVHTLAIKRASKLVEIDKDFHYKQADIVRRMLDYAETKLNEKEYIPYYLYRQKQMAGSLENVGYAKTGTECIYNARIMEERQTIIALGAGGITKVYFPEENRLERVPNVTNYQIYISRLEEMLDRKSKKLFEEVK
ncbi:MAG: coproporphyrinogen dehydrogenase HemZ [Anaerovoracaceae bacterium]